MRYRVLGRSGISVSELCLGTMNFGGPTDEAEARRIIDHALENGVNFIDTANVYTEGRSEEIVGRALEGRRDRVILATKVANPVGHKGLNDRGLSRVHVMQAVEGSLRRLKTDYIDLYYVHRPDPKTPWEDVVRTFGNLVRQGKIRHWALSNVRGWQIAHICHLCRQLNEPEPVALQPYYNLMNRQPEVEVLPAARAYGLGVVPYSPVARGVLTGKYRLNEAPEPGSRVARQDKRIMETEWRPESLQIAEELKAHAEARGMTLIAFAVAWVLNNSAVSSVIAGPRTLEQWKPYLGALEVTWTPEDEAIVDRFVVTGHPSTPGYNDPNYPIEGRFPTVKA
ncbi:MAG: NADP-dependent oxidoreductase [Proteobacteria bacterium]|nr:MAG: NADP-dependent oxidoreductase [Pseudomonadota bacterium]